MSRMPPADFLLALPSLFSASGVAMCLPCSSEYDAAANRFRAISRTDDAHVVLVALGRRTHAGIQRAGDGVALALGIGRVGGQWNADAGRRRAIARVEAAIG